MYDDPSDRKTRVVKVRLDDAAFARLSQLAKRERKQIAALSRELIVEFLDEAPGVGAEAVSTSHA